MSTGDFLFNGNPPSAWTSPIQSTTTMPDWWQAATQGLITQASQLAAQPYPTYPGPQVAGFDPLQKNAYDSATNYFPGVNNQLSTAQNTLNNASQPFNQNQFNQFMNPYTSGVVNSIQDLGNKNLLENILPQVNDTFTGAGQFGSSRNADFTNRAILNEEQNIGQQQSAALNQGFQSSMNAYQQGQQNMINAGNQQGALANVMQNLGQGQVANEFGMGQQSQDLSQKNLDAGVANFQNQFQYPLQMLNNLSGIIHGYQPSGTAFTYNTQPLSQTATYQSPLTSLTSGIAGIAGSQPTQQGR